MRRLAIAVCFATAVSAMAGGAAAASFSTPDHPVVLAGTSVVLAQYRRCTPSRCGCAGNRTTFCTRDCRRDISCACVRGRYVCRKVRR